MAAFQILVCLPRCYKISFTSECTGQNHSGCKTSPPKSLLASLAFNPDYLAFSRSILAAPCLPHITKCLILACLETYHRHCLLVFHAPIDEGFYTLKDFIYRSIVLFPSIPGSLALLNISLHLFEGFFFEKTISVPNAFHLFESHWAINCIFWSIHAQIITNAFPLPSSPDLDRSDDRYLTMYSFTNLVIPSFGCAATQILILNNWSFLLCYTIP